ncbi:hypothetical protein KSS87_013138 [Heliosperma pusillum]|nr:hypothetical protein KSS87_013138 [Heliosperma pusillum]
MPRRRAGEWRPRRGGVVEDDGEREEGGRLRREVEGGADVAERRRGGRGGRLNGNNCRQATARSLCLLDEFGKGTLAEDGIGLLGGTVKYFAESEDTPKVLVCTHLTEIFQESVLPKSEKIMFYTMSVLRPEESSLPVEDIVFLYRLVPGQAHLSYGGCFTTC